MSGSGPPSSATEAAAAVFALDDAALRCPYPYYDTMRDDRPVLWSDAVSAFVVTGAAAAHEVLRDPETYSSRQATGPLSAERLGPIVSAAGDLVGELMEVAASAHPGLLMSDPPEHTALRALVNRSFTPRRVARLEPGIGELAHRLVDDIVEAGATDFFEAFAVPLPIVVIADILGVPETEVQNMKRWSKELVALVGHGAPTRDDVASFLAANREFEDCIGGLIDDRRARPTDDLISELAIAEIGGERLERRVLLDLLRQFVTAGHDTTTALLAAGMHSLVTDADLAERLRARPADIPTFVEEQLRLESPIQGLYRTAEVDTVLGGVLVPAASNVLVLYAAANRDPAAHERPAEVDLDRPAASRHLAFGHGIHFCVGAPLARTEARIAFGVLLDRLWPPGPEIDGDTPHQPSFLLRGLTSLPLRFGPGGAAASVCVG